MAGWGSMLAGGVGVGVGVIAGLQAMEKHRELKSNCVADVCSREHHSDLDSFRNWRSLSTAGYAIGFVGLGAGVVFLLAADTRAETAVRIHPTGAGLRHRF
jgi:hypothetical protein